MAIYKVHIKTEGNTTTYTTNATTLATVTYVQPSAIADGYTDISRRSRQI